MKLMVIKILNVDKVQLYAFVFMFLCILALLSFLSCSGSKDENDKEVGHVVDCFASCYFNLDLVGAVPFCTIESKKWLSFISSNISQADVDIIRTQQVGATHEIGEIEHICDTFVVANCSVFNFLRVDTLGTSGCITEQAVFRIPVVKRNGKWLVKMEGLLQSGRQNHD